MCPVAYPFLSRLLALACGFAFVLAGGPVNAAPAPVGSVIRNTATLNYGVGASPVVLTKPSTAVEMKVIGEPGAAQGRIGIAKAARPTVFGRHDDGTFDGTASLRFVVTIKNYGTVPLHDVQVLDLLEGPGTAQLPRFGTYVAAAVPGLQQYTMVPGSLRSVARPAVDTGAIDIPVNDGFNGTVAAPTLLAPGATLPVGAQFKLQFSVRVNVAERPAYLYNTAQAQAALAAGAAPTVFDDSVEGTEPDPNGDGDPTNDASPTRVSISSTMPVLTLVKTAGAPQRVSAGVYDYDYNLRVTNEGAVPARHVRVLDNLDCAFDMDKAEGLIASWSILKAPSLRNGALTLNGAFTGHGACDRRVFDSTDPFVQPDDPALDLTDSRRTLMPGAFEDIRFTVRVVKKAGAPSGRVFVRNKAWASSFQSGREMALKQAKPMAASESAVESVQVDPEGTVYDAVTRQPVAGAVVRYARRACSSGPARPIGAGELLNETPGSYTFNADGSVSMTTGADGAYEFVLQLPPDAGLCTYSLDVTPPAGSGYVFPSQRIPMAPGVFNGCANVAPNEAAPQGSDPTTWYDQFEEGVNASGAACDVTNNHIPLDPGNLFGLVLRKEGSKRQAELGDFVDYAIRVTNKTGVALRGVHIDDSLPPGFGYIAGSARLDGQPVANPAGGAGPQLGFDFPGLALGVDRSALLHYRLRIGVGAPAHGEAVNRARAHSGVFQSNTARWTVRVTGGVFSDDAFVFGKVHLDCRRSGEQDGADDIGVPGVRLYLEDGTHVITDIEGKWSLYGLKPVTHVLRLDPTTLPAGAQLEVLDHRNAGDPQSRFVDLKKGGFEKANFAIAGCDAPVLAAVAARRAAIIANPAAELEAQVRRRLDTDGRVAAPGDLRGLPASGLTSVTGSGEASLTASSAALIALPAASGQGGSFVGGGAGNGTLGVAGATPLTAAPVGSLFAMRDGASAPMPVSSLSPVATPAQPLVDLETLLPEVADGTPGFIGLKSGDITSSPSINVRVKGEDGLSLRLSLNGQVIDERRVGKKVRQAERHLGAWEYIGVVLRPGTNTLRLEAVDPFGNVRGEAQQIDIVAPGALGSIRIEAPASARTDLRTPVTVRVHLADAAGVAITARTRVTLETDRGRWLADDLDTVQPGTQVFIEGGAGEFRLLPPGDPGDARLRVTAGGAVQETRLAFLAELRPMIGVGMVEGVLDFTKRGRVPVGAAPAGMAFESELSALSGADSATRAGGRAAFFFKGAVKGEYLLTAAFDSDKERKARLFRDIRPDEFYPIYGDSSARGFDAQSTQKLYVRIDKDRSYLLYGDFTTASSTEVRSLSQISRSLTGLKHVYETPDVRATTYVSRTAQTQQVEELRAVGTSGPYYLSAAGGELVDNSEQIEIMVRDRNQPNIVLQRTPVTRFVDYTIEPLTRRILFTHAIASVDANLNPQSIRVTYEVDNGGPKFTVAGTDVQLKVAERLQLGVVAATDENPQNRRKLGALTAIARIGEATTVAAELVRTESTDKGKGEGARVEIRHQAEDLGVVALANKTSAGFDNPGATISAGRTEASTRAEYKLDATTTVRAEALYGKDALLDGQRRGQSVSVQKQFGGQWVGELGLRHGQGDAGMGASLGAGFDYGQVSTYNGSLGSGVGAGNVTALGAAATANAHNAELSTVRARLSAPVPGVPQAQVFIEGEQDLRASDRRALAVGGNYAITDKTRVYGRYELISSLQGPYELDSHRQNNVGIVGIESAYMEGGRVYNEYRLTDSIDGRGAQAAFGIRNTVKLGEHLSVTGGVEHTRSLGGYDNSVNHGTGFGGGLGGSTAITSGLEYVTERYVASGILEARHGDDANTRLFNAGFGYKIDAAWSVLARSIVSDSAGQGANAGNERHVQRHQIGLAYRPVDTDTWNALARYERRSERVVGAGNAAGAGGGLFGKGSDQAALPGGESADILSLHLNYTPWRGGEFSGRYAAKLSRTGDDTLRSRYWAHLLQGRYTQDIGQDWDIGVQAGVMAGKGGSLQKLLGLELGYQVAKNLWVSAGYNFVGLKDRELTANEYTSKGAYLRVRFKFDETALGFAPAGAKPDGR